MITLEGNIKILKLGYKTGHIEVVDLDNDILYVGEVISEVIYESGKPTKVKLYHYTTKETNNWLKKSIKRQQSSNEECSKYIEEVVKENEQLKSTIMEMEDYLGRLEEEIIEVYLK